MREKRESDFKKIVLLNNKKIIKKFKKVFNKEIQMFAHEIFEAYKLCKIIDDQCKNNEQKQYVAMYLFNALNNLISSFNLLISGYLLPSGNLMRHFTESCAMAILSSDDNFFQKIKEENTKFPVHKSLDFVFANKKILDINKNGWIGFNGIKKIYNDYSHASLFSISASFLHCRYGEGITKIGPFFDDGKIDYYKKVINERINAVKSLKNIVNGLKIRINQKS